MYVLEHRGDKCKGLLSLKDTKINYYNGPGPCVCISEREWWDWNESVCLWEWGNGEVSSPHKISNPKNWGRIKKTYLLFSFLLWNIPEISCGADQRLEVFLLFSAVGPVVHCKRSSLHFSVLSKISNRTSLRLRNPRRVNGKYSSKLLKSYFFVVSTNKIKLLLHFYIKNQYKKLNFIIFCMILCQQFSEHQCGKYKKADTLKS
jgi:hypothetical protein